MSGDSDRTLAADDLRAKLKRGFEEESAFKLAQLLRDAAASRPEARELLFRLLSENTSHRRARLLLARLFYLDGMAGFALQQLELLRSGWKSEELNRLIAALGGEAFAGPSASPATPSPASAEHESTPPDVVAEVDIDFDFLEEKA